MFRKPVIDGELTYWRSRSQFEVDFVIGDQLGVEVKSKARVSPRDYKGLLALGEEEKLKRKLVVCGENQRWRADDGVEILPPRDFFRELWAGNLLD